MRRSSVKVIACNNNTSLVEKICDEIGADQLWVNVEEFPNRELRVQVLSDISRDDTILLVASFKHPVERGIFQLGLIADAVSRFSPRKIIAFIPWLPYSPQDKVFRVGEPLSSSVTIQILESFSIDEFITLDLHSSKINEMFSKPMVELSAIDLFVKFFEAMVDNSWVAVALDKGAYTRGKSFSEKVGIPFASFEKKRDRDNGKVDFIKFQGDVEGKNVISFDDFASTGSTRIRGAEYLKSVGALTYSDCVTHTICSAVFQKVGHSEIDKYHTTDSISYEEIGYGDKINVISISQLISSYLYEIYSA